MKKRPVVAGDTLIAHCPVAGYPIDSIVWERDGRYAIEYKNALFKCSIIVIVTNLSISIVINDIYLFIYLFV